MRNRGLNLRGMLRRRTNKNLTIFSAFGPSCLRLEVKMLLPSELNLAGESIRTFCKRGRAIASSNDVRLRVEACLRDCITQSEHRLQWFVLNLHFLRGHAAAFIRIAHDERNNMTVKA